MPARRTWTDDQLREAVQRSVTTAEVLRRLNLVVNGTAYRLMARHVARLHLDTGHFVGQGWANGALDDPETTKRKLRPLLRKGIRVARLKDRLIASGLKEARCEACRITEWLGKPAPLQVDHIDGDHLNNELSNLRIMCANCHMLTDTWGFKGARRRPYLATSARGGIQVDTPVSEAGAERHGGSTPPERTKGL